MKNCTNQFFILILFPVVIHAATSYSYMASCCNILTFLQGTEQVGYIDYHLYNLNGTFVTADLRGLVTEKSTPFELGIEIDGQTIWFCKNHTDYYVFVSCYYHIPLGKTFNFVLKTNFIHGSLKFDTLQLNSDQTVSGVPPVEFAPEPPENPKIFLLRRSWENLYQSPTMIVQGKLLCHLYVPPTPPPAPLQ
uniref:Uncharacterized protein n=1 Tax=Panagrolaimus sp. JU765 TaxID=591449 RepID=A0AC34Q4N4_9BILA